jgi:hypothetical protein
MSLNKDQHDQLIDIFLDVPAIYALSDAAKREISKRKSLIGMIKAVQLCWKLDSELRNWYDLFNASSQGMLYWCELSTIATSADSPILGKLFPVAFRFPTYIIAQTLVLYWAALAIISEQLCRLYKVLGSVEIEIDRDEIETHECTCEESGIPDMPAHICAMHFTTEKCQPLGEREDWSYHIARNICQSVEYFLQPNMRRIGPACILPPLMFLKTAWERNGEESQRQVTWVSEMLLKVQGRMFGKLIWSQGSKRYE